jgi:hypothetical protein
VIKNILVFTYSTLYSCQILMKLGFSWRIFEKYSNLKKTCSVGAQLFHANRRANERTDRYDEANSRFFQFCEYTPKWQFYDYIILERNEKYFITEYFHKRLCRWVLSEDKFRKINTRQCEGTKPKKVERICVKSWNFRGGSKFCSSIWTAKGEEKWKSFIFILMWIFIT